MSLIYTYGGIVEDNADPLHLGRVKARVPHVYGATVSGTGYISTDDMPWAMPAGMPAGGNGNSGGFSHVPEVGDKVWVRFLDGEPEKPIYEWGMQTIKDAESFKLHSYKTGKKGVPDRSVWTKYGQAVELNAGSVLISTSKGYRFTAIDASLPGLFDGSVAMETPLGNFIRLDDFDASGMISILRDLTINVMVDVWGASGNYDWVCTLGSFNFTALAGTFDVETAGAITFTTAAIVSIEAGDSINLTATADINMASSIMTFEFVKLSLGTGSTEPYVLGNQLQAWIMSLYTWLASHTHISGEAGSPTSPPILPPYSFILPEPPMLLSKTITGM